LEEFFLSYEPKFGEKIKVRRFLKNLKEMKDEQQDAMLMLRLSKIKKTSLKKKDIELLKSLDDNTLKKYLEGLKRKNNLPLIVQLMERVKKL
jgi:ribosomal protein L30/L7E